MLRVIEGGGGQEAPLRVEDLPLGPWAGVEVRVWATKTGSRWHADSDCSSLKSQARTDVFAQPAEGTLGQRRLPPGLHCVPPARLGHYLEAAERLVRFAAETDEAERQWDAGGIPLSALPGRHGWLLSRAEREEFEAGPLASLWEREHERRQQLVARADAQLAPGGNRLPIMLMADWVRRGRTPREHQPRYRRFVQVGEEEFDAATITSSIGIKRHINLDLLPDWLYVVASGGTCGNATTGLAQREYENALRKNRSEDGELPQRVRDVWTAVGTRWQYMLDAMALAHPGSALALFRLYGSGIDPDLLDVCIRRGPSARLHVGHLDWAIAVVPASCRVVFAGGEDGPGGLVLMQEPLYGVNAASCQRFLRNLVRSLGHPEFVDRVGERDADTDRAVSHRCTDAELDASFALSQRGFADDVSSHRLTVAQCADSLRAAVRGEDLPYPTKRRTGRGR